MANCNSNNCGCSTSSCGDKFNCGTTCPDFVIKRHDTRPVFRASIEDCDGVMDLTDETLVAEASMWTTAKFKKALTETDTYFQVADGIGFDQIMVNDIIVVNQVRMPEQMIVTGFDETNKYVQVQRGYHGSTACAYKKGQSFKIFRILNAPASIESNYEDILQIDGTTLTDQLTATFITYTWSSEDTCLPGCYEMEFKLLKYQNIVTSFTTSSEEITPSFIPSLTPENYGCYLVDGVEWVRRFPVQGNFNIQIIDSPTSELIVF